MIKGTSVSLQRMADYGRDGRGVEAAVLESVGAKLWGWHPRLLSDGYQRVRAGSPWLLERPISFAGLICRFYCVTTCRFCDNLFS
jgi:hypothetical protein